MDNPFLRQLDLINQRQLGRLSLTIVGCDSIGSFTALALSKMGLGKLVLYDMDKIEDHNISTQFFTHLQKGENKAKLTEKMCYMFSSIMNVWNHPYKFENEEIKTDIVLASTDNIEGRQAVFMSALKSDKCKLYIDVRMQGNNLKVFTVNLENEEEINSFVNDFLLDVENKLGSCTARTIIYNVLMCASLISDIVKRYASYEPLPKHIAFSFKDYYQIVDMNKEG